MHRLNKSQVKKAEKLSETHTCKDLGQMSMDATGKETEILAWAIYLRSMSERRAKGIAEPPGYSGRQSNRR